MKSSLICGIAASLCLGVLLVPQPGRPLFAAEDAQPFRQADKTLADALSKKDSKAVAALLDDRFQWVEANGRIHTKAQVLDDLAEFATDNEGAIDVLW